MRAVATCLSLFLAGGAAAADNSEALAELERTTGGRIGVVAFVPATGAAVSWRGDERFAMASTFKLLLAALILKRVDAGTVSLDRRLAIERNDLVSYSPITEKVVGGTLSIAELLDAVVSTSDNTAANLLLDVLGGPDAFTAALRDTGDAMTRLDRNEPALNDNLADAEHDTTTPAAMARSVARFALGESLSASSRQRLLGWLRASTTGRHRLRAGLPGNWVVGDKTGTGANGAFNDVAVIHPPGCEPTVLAVYTDRASQSVRQMNAVHVRIARLLTDWIRAESCPAAGSPSAGTDS